MGQFGFQINQKSFRFYSYCDLLRDAVKQSLHNWSPPKTGKIAKIKSEYQDNVIDKWKTQSLTQKYVKILSKSFHEIWLKMLANADNEMLALDKGLFRAKGPKADFGDFEKLYSNIKENKFALKDATNYIPACLFYLTNKCYDNNHRPQFINHDEDWKAFYSLDNKQYGHLNKTLMNIKYPVRFDILLKLRELRLPRPVLSRTELYSLILSVSRFKNIVVKSDKNEILKAVRYFNQINQRDVKCNSFNQFNQFWIDINDYPENYYGTIKGLVKRSHEWHERQLRDGIVRSAKRNGYYTGQKLAIPPFSLEKLDKKIKFLDTVGKLCDEGIKLGHCVGTYSDRAVRGRSFIFSIEYQKELATLELVANPWVVNQCRGPRNRPNKASKWAEKYFKRFILQEKLNECNGTTMGRIILPSTVINNRNDGDEDDVEF
jgi:hypothetical protein